MSKVKQESSNVTLDWESKIRDEIKSISLLGDYNVVEDCIITLLKREIKKAVEEMDRECRISTNRDFPFEKKVVLSKRVIK